MTEYEQAERALNEVLKPLGTNLRHYMQVHKEAAVQAMVAVLRAAKAGSAE